VLFEESKKRFDEDAEFRERTLQDLDDRHKIAWEQICEISCERYQKVYQRLGVHVKEEVKNSMASTLARLKADHLRHRTLQQMSRILLMPQAAKGLLALGEYFQRLRVLNSLWVYIRGFPSLLLNLRVYSIVTPPRRSRPEYGDTVEAKSSEALYVYLWLKMLADTYVPDEDKVLYLTSQEENIIEGPHSDASLKALVDFTSSASSRQNRAYTDVSKKNGRLSARIIYAAE
nr:DOG1 domain-containing protein [Tanacetum cinerariifolium]